MRNDCNVAVFHNAHVMKDEGISERVEGEAEDAQRQRIREAMRHRSGRKRRRGGREGRRREETSVHLCVSVGGKARDTHDHHKDSSFLFPFLLFLQASC